MLEHGVADRPRRASCTRTARRDLVRDARPRRARRARATSSSCRSVARDVTERRRAEETLRASEAAAVAARDALSERARRDDAVRHHRHRRRRPDHGLQRWRRAHARLSRGRPRRAPPPRSLPRPRGARAPRGRVRRAGRARARLRHAPQGHRHARLDARPQRRRQAAGLAHDHGDPHARDGALTGYLGIGRDITAERQAARELRDAEERFRNAFDKAPIGKALVSTEGGSCASTTRSARIIGYAEQESARDDVPVADAPRRSRRRPRARASPARGRERCLCDGEALPARRRPLHLGPPERLAGARRGAARRSTSSRRSRTSASRS